MTKFIEQISKFLLRNEDENKTDSTSTPINHIVFFFVQNTSCIRKPQVISGGGGGGAPPPPPPHPLLPPSRSAPVNTLKLFE